MAHSGFNEVEKNAAELQKKFDAIKQDGLKVVGHEILKDADEVEPKIPVDTGELQDSGFVEETDDGVIVGFSADHAILVHEKLDPGINWSRPGSGGDFLRSKLQNATLHEKYRKLLGQYISNALK